jgi:hypothetical protein
MQPKYNTKPYLIDTEYYSKNLGNARCSISDDHCALLRHISEPTGCSYS